MKKLIFAGLLCAMVCVCAPGAAGTVLNVDLPKETLTEREAADRHISTRPEGLKVTRQSVIPWDDAGERWSILVELENVSEEAVIIDDTWLIACNAQKEEQARWYVPAIDGAFWKTGERCSRADGWCSSRERMKSEHGFNIRRPVKRPKKRCRPPG